MQSRWGCGYFLCFLGLCIPLSGSSVPICSFCIRNPIYIPHRIFPPPAETGEEDGETQVAWKGIKDQKYKGGGEIGLIFTLDEDAGRRKDPAVSQGTDTLS